MAETAPIAAIRRAKVTRTELRNVEFYRREGRLDRERAEARSLKYQKFLTVYEAMRERPGVWFTRDDIAEVSGYSIRHSRRMIKLFQAIGHPFIEVVYTAKHQGTQSRMRWVQ